eukprot:m.248114 g.248114  ORF g.248114 m.248114 type:complete len:496 (+) comp15630_c0_seq1:75-1562(+)
MTFQPATRGSSKTPPDPMDLADAEDRRLVLKRCLTALGLERPDDLIHYLRVDNAAPHHHIFAAQSPSGKFKVHMRGTSNSKRFVHILLYWLVMVGFRYPVGDYLLSNWRCFHSVCEYGFERETGHKKHPASVCINPYHVRGVSETILLDILRTDALQLCDLMHGHPFFVALRERLASQMDDLYSLSSYLKEHCPAFPNRMHSHFTSFTPAWSAFHIHDRTRLFPPVDELAVTLCPLQPVSLPDAHEMEACVVTERPSLLPYCKFYPRKLSHSLALGTQVLQSDSTWPQSAHTHPETTTAALLAEPMPSLSAAQVEPIAAPGPVGGPQSRPTGDGTPGQLPWPSTSLPDSAFFGNFQCHPGDILATHAPPDEGTRLSPLLTGPSELEPESSTFSLPASLARRAPVRQLLFSDAEGDLRGLPHPRLSHIAVRQRAIGAERTVATTNLAPAQLLHRSHPYRRPHDRPSNMALLATLALLQSDAPQTVQTEQLHLPAVL